ncbi:MAG TPA: glycosyltransferase family 2 protein [Candidatus Obscuribacterales bacterium]
MPAGEHCSAAKKGRRRLDCSVVIPVYNSSNTVPEVIRRTAAVLEQGGWSYEIIAVDDGSTDGSWDVLQKEAVNNPRVTVIGLVKNYGQHPALLCGLAHSSGDYVVTIDDDLQNPPEEIVRLLEKGREGYDLVCGRFYKKQHELYRRLGSRLIALVNEKIFRKPRHFYLTNFRLMERRLVDRICAYQTAFPYVNGLACMLAGRMANVWVEHHARRDGESRYSLGRILTLVLTILFNYSAYPLRLACTVGLAVSVASFIMSGYFIFKGIFLHSSVPGWTSIVTLLSFFNGVLMLILGMLGEYVIRILNTSADHRSYHIREICKFD